MSSAEIIEFPGGERFLTAPEAADYLRVSVRTIQRWRGVGLPFHKIGGRVLFRRSELDDWVDSAFSGGLPA